MLKSHIKAPDDLLQIYSGFTQIATVLNHPLVYNEGL